MPTWTETYTLPPALSLPSAALELLLSLFHRHQQRPLVLSRGAELPCALPVPRTAWAPPPAPQRCRSPGGPGRRGGARRAPGGVRRAVTWPRSSAPSALRHGCGGCRRLGAALPARPGAARRQHAAHQGLRAARHHHLLQGTARRALAALPERSGGGCGASPGRVPCGRRQLQGPGRGRNAGCTAGPRGRCRRHRRGERSVLAERPRRSQWERGGRSRQPMGTRRRRPAANRRGPSGAEPRGPSRLRPGGTGGTIAGRSGRSRGSSASAGPAA